MEFARNVWQAKNQELQGDGGGEHVKVELTGTLRPYPPGPTSPLQHLLVLIAEDSTSVKIEDNHSDLTGPKNPSHALSAKAFLFPHLRIYFSEVFQERHRC